MSAPQLFVGVDVAKAQLDMAVANDDAGMATLVARLQAVQPTLMVLEATGGYQRAVVAALAAAGLPVAVGNPCQARDGAKATGPLANTEALDARALARLRKPCARPLGPCQRPKPTSVERCWRGGGNSCNGSGGSPLRSAAQGIPRPVVDPVPASPR